MRLLAGLALVSLFAAPALALHRESQNVTRITSGGPHLHPRGRHWSTNGISFTSGTDLLGNGTLGQQLFVFSLLAYDCNNFLTREGTPDHEGTPCPNPPRPALQQLTNTPARPANPSLTYAEGNQVVAFDADGSFSGRTGASASRRQIFILRINERRSPAGHGRDRRRQCQSLAHQERERGDLRVDSGVEEGPRARRPADIRVPQPTRRHPAAHPDHAGARPEREPDAEQGREPDHVRVDRRSPRHRRRHGHLADTSSPTSSGTCSCRGSRSRRSRAATARASTPTWRTTGISSSSSRPRRTSPTAVERQGRRSTRRLRSRAASRPSSRSPRRFPMATVTIRASARWGIASRSSVTATRSSTERRGTAPSSSP